MQNRKETIKDFNNILEEFIDKMILQFPTEKKLKSYRSAYRVSKNLDKTMPINIVMSSLMHFKDQIRDKDEDFFRNSKTFVNKAVRASSFSNDLGLVNYWDSLSDNSKTAIWEYVQTLFILGETYINNDPLAISNINNISNNLTFNESIDVIEKNNTYTEEFINKINK
tara:strand:- start:798 stop:1301 length:504 start_codon:yes stop_codon:yes gene_type:complete